MNWHSIKGQILDLRLSEVILFAFTFFLVWCPPDPVLRSSLFFVLLIAGFVLKRKVALSRRNLWILLLSATAFVIYITMFIGWRPPQSILNVPAAFNYPKQYDPEKYIPTGPYMMLRNLYIFQTFLGVVLLILFRSDDKVRSGVFFNVIKYVLMANVLFWVTQYVLYYTLGVVFSPLGTNRYMGTLPGGIDLFRGPGLFNEPGTYVNALFPILMIYHLYLRRIDWLQLLTLFSFFLSFSLFGWMFIGQFLLSVFQWNKRYLLRLGAMLTVVGLMSYDVVASYLELRFFSKSSFNYSLNSKLYAFQFWLNEPIERKFLGNWGVNDCKCLYYDSSLLFTLVNEYGFLGLAAVCGVAWYLRKEAKYLYFFLCSLTIKLHFGYPVIGVFLFFLLHLYRGRTRTCEQ